jgi:hypothetical protein
LVESVALGRHPEHGDIAAIAARGRVRLVALPDGGEIPNPADQATVVTAVALGRIFDEDVLVTGSKGGVLVVSGLATHSRIAALTLDGPIERVWVVRGADSVAAKSDTNVYVMDLLRGAAL